MSRSITQYFTEETNSKPLVPPKINIENFLKFIKRPFTPVVDPKNPNPPKSKYDFKMFEKRFDSQ